jgi:anthranilate synthase/aminodeoxychorismate synthase-like glutamine amidotransferase
MHLVIDNYDSFTYNVVQYLGALGAEVVVRRSDEIGIRDIEAMKPTSLIVSPGPCTPDEAGISTEAIRRFASRIPILGVCLGHQCIAAAFGGRIRRAGAVMHGKVSRIRHRPHPLFNGIPQNIAVARYHSLVVDDLPSSLEIIARTAEEGGKAGEIMAIAHRHLPIVGVQFHPESVLTEYGLEMLANFLALSGRSNVASPSDIRVPVAHFRPDRPSAISAVH